LTEFAIGMKISVMIEIKNLTKSYGSIKAIENLNFKINKGEVVGFLGPNGAGKSTTMKIITGYMAPTSGLVSIAGYDIFENPIEVKKRIGYLPEVPPVYLDMQVDDFLSYVAQLKKVPKSELNKKVQRAIEKTYLGDVRKRLIGNLSKGFKQRVGIAEAIVSEPEILILDEPTVGLDPKQVAEIRTLIQTLSGEHTVILSTHILSEVQATCKRIIIINKGKIVAEDTLEGLNRKMRGSHQILLKVKNSTDSLKTKLKTLKGVLEIQDKGSGHLVIDTMEPDDVIMERIAQVSIETHSGLMELRHLEGNLEEIFIKLTSNL
jgi:ABC-2 type transport system ATP-binding protein